MHHPRRPETRRAPRGQAMVEYSILNWVLVVALTFGLTVNWVPTANTAESAANRRTNVIKMFLNAYQIYYDSFYFVLNLPFP